MTPAGLHQSCLIPLIQRGLISVLTTTGANLYHDAHRIIGHAIREVNPNAGDLALRLARIIRIYDLGFWEEALLDTDRLFSAIIRGPEFQRKMTTPEIPTSCSAKKVSEIEKSLKVKQPSLLSTCYQFGVPIFVGAVQDGSIFLNVVKLKKLLGAEFKFEIDINDDVYAMAAMQHYCRHHGSKKLAIWILGGGRPQELHPAGRAAAGSDPQRSPPRASTSTFSSVWTQSTTGPSRVVPRARAIPGGR